MGALVFEKCSIPMTKLKLDRVINLAETIV